MNGKRFSNLKSSGIGKNLKKYKYNSILLRNFAVITLLVILAIIILNAFYSNKMEENVRNEIRESSFGELRRSADTIDAVIEQMNNFAYYTSINNGLKLLYISDNVREDSENVNALKDRIVTFSNTFEHVDSVYIYVAKYDYVVCGDGKMELSEMEDRNWVSLYEEEVERNYILKSRSANNGYPFILTMMYPIQNVNGERIGAIFINVNIEDLNDTIGRSYKDQQCLFMVGPEGELYYSNVSKAIKRSEYIPDGMEQIWQDTEVDSEYFEIKEDKNNNIILSAVKSSYGEWFYWLYSPMDFYNERLALTTEYITYSMIWTILLGVVLSYILTIRSYQPIQHIMSAVEGIEDVQDEFIEGENRENEIQYISNLILNTKRKNVKLKVEVDEWIERLGRAQLQALQSQINPHFLYNTLDTINWMVMEKNGESNEISQAIYSLAQLLRISTKRTTYLITLEEELEHVKLYMELLDIRYPGKIKVHWEIDKSLYTFRVVRLSLQPILENAVRHGLRSRRYEGHIYIRGDVVNDTLVIRIEDDGIGMTEEACRAMNDVLNTEYQVVDNHVGIKNVNQRIKILFGENYGIQLRTRDEGGLVVVLCFPV